MSSEPGVNDPVSGWPSLFASYRVAVLRGEEVIQGTLRPELKADGAQLRSALASWDGASFVQPGAAGTEVTLVRRIAPLLPERWWLHALLLALTVLTTTLAGAMLLGLEPLRLVWMDAGPFPLPVPARLSATDLIPGLMFSLPLVGILLGHELGHYRLGRRRGMDVSPPFFIPSPPGVNLIGTFGAFIRLRSPMINRAVLLDVGAAGPIASFVLAIPVALLGLALSDTVQAPPGGAPTPFVILYGTQPIWLGGSLLFHALAGAFGGGDGILLLHPLAFAGWLGLFVTALNLFPLSQLDGGHILYALAGARQRWFGLAFLAVLAALGTLWWGWWLWTAMVLLIGRGSIRHPPVFDPAFRVVGARRAVGWLCIVIFVLTFVAVPLQL